MTVDDISRVVVTVGVVQFLCNLAANRLVFRTESYERALAALSRHKFKLDKEKAAAVGKSPDKTAKKLKRAEDDYAEALGNVSKAHVVPGIVMSLVFVILLRVMGLDFKGRIVGVIPFAPITFLRRIANRGLEYSTQEFQATSPFVTDTSQGCAFMFIYMLSTLSVKFYVNKLFGTPQPTGSQGVLSFMESPQGQKIAKSFGLDPASYKAE